ncbi:U32 family peptidase [Bullifex sp.]|uniref:peptidase U32 family protein n=1 Tax=Bullifex sp. TaxID=2815808 RepID=UPI002A83117B|nr:U32 family peptidase [Bullifex sp.]MDD5972544.1 U32 family peptidase [Spirochaetales bacterium]MDY4066209.1 U32 family peptidase [Bullifex sp.]
MSNIELLSPAGNVEKLKTAINFGADACYMGLTNYSLRKNAGNFKEDELEEVKRIKAESGKKLYCTMNIIFSEKQIQEVKEFLPTLKDSPFDAFIITDIGLVPLFKKYLPSKALHLSTQASCINSESAKMYHDMGFERVILGREASLDDIKRIKDSVPELELEAFVHGAMCMSYSGRCLLSSFLTGRSANQGDCSHTCRWNYKLHYALEEEERKGIYYPIEEDESGYTTILSSKDLCMIDHLEDLRNAGLSSLKIEGRMKSVYYVAVVTRAYRKALDNDVDKDIFRRDIFNVSHREFSTGFFYGRDSNEGAINRPTSYGYQREYMYLGTILEDLGNGKYAVDVRNQIKCGKMVEYLGPDIYSIADDSFRLVDEDGHEIAKLDHGKKGYLITDKKLKKGYILRSESDIKTLN